MNFISEKKSIETLGNELFIVQDQKSIDTAIIMQHTATYGDLRSPIRANFQNVPSALNSIKRINLVETI